MEISPVRFRCNLHIFYINSAIRQIVFIILTATAFSACKNYTPPAEHITSLPFRLKPGQDLRTGIDSVVKQHAVSAGWVATCAGSLTDYRIRFANQSEAVTGEGHFEIVSLSGTTSTNGSHLHISISDSLGHTIGGHLLEGCKIYTTAEIVLLTTDSWSFRREKDGSTPWEELQVLPDTN